MISPEQLFAAPPPDRGEFVMRQAIRVNPEQWRRRLPDPSWWPDRLNHCPLVAGWPVIDRRTVFDIALNANSLTGRRSLLVAAVAWGTGTNARPLAFRAKIFTDNSATWIDERLTKALAALTEGDPVGAYLVMNEVGARVKHLGPAFFTKVLYFAAGTEPCGQLWPLILDQNVVKALNALVPGLAWDPTGRWTTSQYAVYLEHAHKWAERWRAAPDVVERTLFEFGKRRASPSRPQARR
ncbi:hypothetical protein [Streptomyces sp. NBC_00063]|uniref:8-oxoguanine DNA glycosylase OGG fold protein n=1 Tax=Streptomyces sp. NBC_00063 TaxID=2975638 RepID=UPI002259FEE2|nr:hypothetical protein [Streptomyces sp. NBC_00063]MCX5440899.1 hypothetical protein [Streptomyces sp. NBC_00063]